VSSESRWPEDLIERARRVRLLGLDVDGTLTDGRLWFGPGGEALKAFDVHDGQGLKLLMRAGIEIALVTARRSEIVARRAAELGIERVIQGSQNKGEALLALCAELSIDISEAGFMGDDLPDIAALRLAGFAAIPANAHAWVIPYAHWQTRAAGGAGAVRELCDWLIAARGERETLLASFGA